MTNPRTLLLLITCCACQAKGDREAQPGPSPQIAKPVVPSPLDALNDLDQRRPVPLLPMMAHHQKASMREHLEAVQAVVAATAVGDFDAVAAAGKRMGFSEAMGSMCEHMGAAAPGFAEQALGFHHTADEITAAAARR